MGERDDNPHVFLVEEGIVRQYYLSDKGNEFTASLYSPGRVFPMLLPQASHLNGRNFAAVTETRLRRASRQEWLRLLESKPACYTQLTGQLWQEMAATSDRLKNLVFGSARNRIAAALVLGADHFARSQPPRPTGAAPNLPLTHQQIADLTGITRETTSLELKKMEREGLLNYLGRTMIIKNLAVLKKEAAF